jgi:hypothetical protein
LPRSDCALPILSIGDELAVSGKFCHKDVVFSAHWTKECLAMKSPAKSTLRLAKIALTALSVTCLGTVYAQDAAESVEKPEIVKVAKPGQLTEEQLGNLLKALGLDVKKLESRYDFQFKAVHNKEEWELSMTAVLSQDGSSIWLMAWLDQLPRSAADVPRTALLRLLSDNDRMGNGKFFAYVATNRRFVLQRVVANENVTTKTFRAWLDDLGLSVAETFDHWSVANWTSTEGGTSTAASSTPAASTKPQSGATGSTSGRGSSPAPNFEGAGQNPIRTALPAKTDAIRK